MTDPTPFRFGVQAAHATSHEQWVELARRCESLGYDVLTMPDHFGDQLAPIPALMTAANATTTLRVGALVFDNDYKHPLVLAKELATMDVLSGGRVEVGLGAGWMVSDYDESGIPYDTPKVRIDRFVEGLAVIKGCFGPDAFSFSGDHYTIANHNALPKPLQSPPPLLIGGGGPRVLKIAAREADIVGINGTLTAGVVGPEAIATMTAASVDDKIGIVRAAAGERIAAIELNIRVFMMNFTPDRAGVMSAIGNAVGMGADFVEESPFALIGTAEQMTEDLLARRDRWGFSYVIIGAEHVDAFAPVAAALAGR